MDQEPVNLLEPKLPNQLPRKRRTALYFFIILAFLAVFIFRRYTVTSWPNNADAYDAATLHPKQVSILQAVKNFIFHGNNLLAGQTDDRINILALGIGGVGHDGPFLSDTNIIISLKPSTKEAALISVPRDLGAKINDHGWRKINSANAFGEAQNPGQGGEYARQVFSDTFNLSIPYYVRVDFQAFTKLIDAVGGITVDVPRGFSDSLFPGPNNSYQTVTFTAGLQTMNGEQALNYARSRHGSNGEGSDFSRAKRQQLILSALKEKLLTAGTYLNPVRIQQIITSLDSHVETNLDFGQMMYLASLAKNLNTPIKTLVLDSSPKGFLVNTTGDNGAFILSPKTGNFADINNAVADIFTTASATPTLNLTATITSTKQATFSKTKIEVQNGTWQAGLAARFQKRLTDKGFDVIAVGNSLKRPLATTTLFLINSTADKNALNALAKELRLPVAATLPVWLTENYDNPATIDNEQGMKYNNEADIVVILGEDAKE